MRGGTSAVTGLQYVTPRLRAYFWWAFWVAVAFFALYPTLNWMTSTRGGLLRLYIDWELKVPLVPEFIWAYLSMYVLFLLPPCFLSASALRALGQQLVAGTVVAGVCFLLFPATLGFARIIPEDPLYGAVFTNLFHIDHPHNLVPSLHVVFSAAILLALADGAPSVWRGVWFGWLALLVISTLLVHQHHLLDIVSAFVLVFLLRRLFEVRDA